MKRIKYLLCLLIVLGGLVLGVSCKKGEDIEIYTTVYALDFVTKEIVQDKVKVKSIYPKSAEVHEYEPTPKELIKMARADIIFFIGQGLEPFIEKGLNSTFKNTNCVNISSYSSLNLVSYDGSHGHAGSDQHGAIESSFDPHIWLDPNLMEEITNIILSNILNVEKFQQYETEFRTNANNLIAKFRDLVSEYNALLKTNKKLIIVDHDAYAYWTYRYNIQRKSLRGDNESSDPNSKELIDIINLAKENDIHYLLATKYEAQESLINSYLDYFNKDGSDFKCEVLYLDNLETLVDDKDDYFSIMRVNLELLLKALE